MNIADLVSIFGTVDNKSVSDCSTIIHKLVTIDKPTAAKLLSTNTFNRKLRVSVVKQLEAALADNTFIYTPHSPLAFKVLKNGHIQLGHYNH